MYRLDLVMKNFSKILWVWLLRSLAWRGLNLYLFHQQIMVHKQQVSGLFDGQTAHAYRMKSKDCLP